MKRQISSEYTVVCTQPSDSQRPGKVTCSQVHQGRSHQDLQQS